MRRVMGTGLGVRHDMGYSEESVSGGISYLIATMDSVIEASGAGSDQGNILI